MRSQTRALRRSFTLAVLAAGASAIVLGLVGPAAAQTLETGPIKVTDSGSITPSGYALKGVTGTGNNSGLFGYGNVSSSAINIDGVVGYVQTQQSVGVVGWAQSTGTSAYGLYGYSATGPGVYGFNANGATASVLGVNNDGVGVMGNGATAGVWGQSSTATGTFGLLDTSTVTNYGGVGGADQSTITGDIGTFGYSYLGTGVFGTADGPAAATSQAGYFLSNDGADVIDSYQHNGGAFGIYSDTDSGLTAGWFEAGSAGPALWGLVALSQSSGATAILGLDNGTGAIIGGEGGSAATPVLAADEDTAGMYSFATYNDTGSGGPGPNNESFVVSDTVNYSGDALVPGTDLNVSGDLYVGGRVYTFCEQANQFPETSGADCSFGPYVAKTPSGAKVRTYSGAQSLPTLEDFGEAQLVNGQAAVSLEHTFASTIDRSRSYLVFITPEGDSHGLYVASKTPSGFIVRESMSGHSTLAFQYRIVAHPYGDASTRMAAISARSHVSNMGHRLAKPLATHSTQFAYALARSKSQRTIGGHRTVHIPASPTLPARPVVNAIKAAQSH